MINDISALTDTTLEAVIETYGVNVDVLKYNTAPASHSVYNRRVVSFASLVVVKAHIAYGKIEEEVSPFGNNIKYEASALFSKKALAAAFPVLDIREAITTSDRLGFGGNQWNIVAVSQGGLLVSDPSYLFLALMIEPSTKSETYP